MDCKGVGKIIRESDVIDSQLNEISLEYDTIYIRPEIRLIMSTLAAFYTARSINMQKEEENKKKKVDIKTKEEFDDI
jgi:hypothetical protein